jgi:hypothetical protein
MPPGEQKIVTVRTRDVRIVHSMPGRARLRIPRLHEGESKAFGSIQTQPVWWLCIRATFLRTHLSKRYYASVGPRGRKGGYELISRFTRGPQGRLGSTARPRGRRRKNCRPPPGPAGDGNRYPS